MSAQALSEEIDQKVKEAMNLRREAKEHAMIAKNQANALLALQNAMATVVAEESDPDADPNDPQL